MVVKTTVSPWQPQNHIPTDAFRPTLAKVFEVLEHVEHARVVNGYGTHIVYAGHRLRSNNLVFGTAISEDPG